MLRQITRSAGALLAAALLSLCFPSGQIAWLAWLALVPLILCVEQDPLPVAFARGYAAGFFFFILTLFWIHHVTALGLVVLSSYLALYWGVFALGVAHSAFWAPWRRVIFLASLWTALEYMRATAFTGFGWSSLAHTQAGNLLLIQIVDITGIWGISFLMSAVSTVAALWAGILLRRERISLEIQRVSAALGCLIVLTAFYGVARLNDLVQGQGPAVVRVALIQGNISLADYWDPLLKPHVVEKYLALSRGILPEKPDLVVWPETSFPQFMWDHPALFEKVRSFARENRVPVLLGAVTRTGEEYFNSAILIDKTGAMARVYSKQHLVLFGEYIPWRHVFPWLERMVPIDDFTPGKGHVLFDVGGITFAALVCFEDTIPALAGGGVLAGADFLVNITNDAWFGASRQPRMHLDNAVFRAVETRSALVRATNTGMSCGVLPSGELAACVQDRAGRSTMTEGTVVLDVPLCRAPGTFYTKFGDVLALLCFPGILGLISMKTREGK